MNSNKSPRFISIDIGSYKDSVRKARPVPASTQIVGRQSAGILVIDGIPYFFKNAIFAYSLTRQRALHCSPTTSPKDWCFSTPLHFPFRWTCTKYLLVNFLWPLLPQHCRVSWNWTLVLMLYSEYMAYHLQRISETNKPCLLCEPKLSCSCHFIQEMLNELMFKSSVFMSMYEIICE